MTYPDAPAPRGSRLVPEVAAGFPKISQQREDLHVHAEEDVQVQQRQEGHGSQLRGRDQPQPQPKGWPRRRSRSSRTSWVRRRHRRQGATKASGVKVLSPYKLQITLTKRAPDLLSRLAMPFFSPIPANLPINPTAWALRSSAPARTTSPSGSPSARSRCCGTRTTRARVRTTSTESTTTSACRCQTIRLNIESNATDFGPVPPAAHAELGQKYGVRKSVSGPVLRQPVSGLPLSGDEPRAAALRWHRPRATSG